MDVTRLTKAGDIHHKSTATRSVPPLFENQVAVSLRSAGFICRMRAFGGMPGTAAGAKAARPRAPSPSRYEKAKDYHQ